MADSHLLKSSQVTDSDAVHEQKFRLLVSSVVDYAIFMLDRDGRVTTWNAGAQRIKGYSADEIVGQPLEVFYPPDAVASNWPRQELLLAVEHGRYEDEGWRVRKDGTRFWASVVITALRDEGGQLQGFAKVTRDLTERRRQDEALRQSEERFRLLVESVKDYAIFMLDPCGLILTCNAGAAAISGYSEQEVLHRHFSIFFTAEDVANHVPDQELMAARRDGHAEYENWRVRKDGSVFWAHVVITPMVDREGVLRGYAKVARDLSDQRRLVELEHATRRLNEFIAMLGHELRNPLAPIRNAVSIMQMQQTLPPMLTRVTEIIDRQLGYLTRLVDDLVDVGRIVHGKIVLRAEIIDFRDVVSAALEATRPLITARGLRLTLDMPQQPVAISGDATRLVQALQNLVNNAVRYTPREGEILIKVWTQGVHCVATVSDTGVGIAPQALERIFELFAQEGQTGTTPESGLGIGLSLARTLVEQHGGMLTAASAGLGCGSTFTMRLPLRHVQLPVSVSRHGADTFRLRRVLVVDDNRDSANTMVSLLRLMGHQATGAYGGDHAVGEVQTFCPEVVLLDINMPDGDGFSVMRRLRARVAAPLFIVAMTGYGQEVDRRRALEAGFQAHLTKPVGAEQLRRVLLEFAQNDTH